MRSLTLVRIVSINDRDAELRQSLVKLLHLPIECGQDGIQRRNFHYHAGSTGRPLYQPKCHGKFGGRVGAPSLATGHFDDEREIRRTIKEFARAG